MPKKRKKNSRLEQIAEEIAVGIMRTLSKLPEEEQERRIRKAEKTLADAKLRGRSERRRARK